MNARMSGMATQRFASTDLDNWKHAELAMLAGVPPNSVPTTAAAAAVVSAAASSSALDQEVVKDPSQHQHRHAAGRQSAPQLTQPIRPTTTQEAPLEQPELANPTKPERLFLIGHEVTNHDAFSASWWQRIDRFLELDAEHEINTVEDDSFKPILKAGRGHDDIRMTRDLLDFCVEHLSKWWKDSGGEAVVYARDVLSNYTTRIRSQSRPQDEYMNTTIAVIPYGVKDSSSEATKLLWVNALAATMTALLDHGVARIVVVGYYKTDELLARQVFQILSRNEAAAWQQSDDNTQFETMVGASEVAFVHTDNVKSLYVSENIPKGALVGLQDALAGRSESPASYLGASNTSDRFQYVFLTEADQILNARITPEFFTAMEDGKIIVPHRAQPMPHPDDLHGLRLSTGMKSLPGHKKVVSLDATSDSCCDTGYHQQGYQKVCKSHWFRCDYSNVNAAFRHLDEYDFISLSQGTRVVILAGNQHSRKCSPVKNGRGKC